MISLKSSIPQMNGRCPGVDENTVALWLFDEKPYANVILTDAGPHQIDLRLSTGFRTNLPQSMVDNTRGLVEGRFGRALHLPVAENVWIDQPEFSRIQDAAAGTRDELPPPFDRGYDLPECCNLGNLDFTLEFWYCMSGEQLEPGVLWAIRNGKPRSRNEGYLYNENALVMDTGRKAFRITSLGLHPKNSWEFEVVIPTDEEKLNDGKWHHLAFTFTSKEKQICHYVDGIPQKLPLPGIMLPVRGFIDSMTIGNDTEGKRSIMGLLDEYRISDVIRYQGEFTPPGSFSRNYSSFASQPGAADGLPLLFCKEQSNGFIQLENRRHLFIDDALLERADGVSFTVNPPTKFEVTDFRATNSWEPSNRLGPMIPDVCSVWDDGNRLGMLYGNNGQFSGKYSTVSLAWSEDGIHWTKPDLGVTNWEGSTQNNIVLRNALQGTVIRDTNPLCPPEERYKLAAWTMNRGFHIFTSQDAIHWSRNETLMFPFDPDGSIEIFWDDQLGAYRGYSRALWGDDFMRYIIQSKTMEIYKPWPFMSNSQPRWHEYERFGMPRPCSNELPLVETWGEVYRFKGHKYPWAPDAYLAFPWRYIREKNVRPGSYLQVSRDGDNWTKYELPYYFGSGWNLNGRTVIEGMIEQGMVRRGDEVWQFGTVRFTEHGGIMLGGVEHEGGYFDCFMRITQRLDGFVSLDAADAPGIITTKLLTFKGTGLYVNAKVKGALRAGLQDCHGRDIPGFGLEDCEPFSGDKTNHLITWKAGRCIEQLNDIKVKLQIQLADGKLYAIQFK